jgi:hypothetical protein
MFQSYGDSEALPLSEAGAVSIETPFLFIKLKENLIRF